MLGAAFDGYLIRHVLTQNDVHYVVSKKYAENYRLRYCALAMGFNLGDMIDISDRMNTDEKANTFVISRIDDKFYRKGKEILDIHTYFR